ncbi:hypothetical protein DSCA_37090 [Desulfosarcina alkanivorans]|uniref:AMP-dependent synthetase/ligase domain-containing protein n=1 Tax=Desulfosarcina alkanivorans TaxID=571177 RepID=A0A5K7YPI2_9BACT|nr:hypothetical protein DSCA_37090 [Desulfosarcina alkanivorans]
MPKKYPEREALVFKDRRVTYKELDKKANELGKVLIEFGIEKVDKVAIMSHNCIQYAILLFAVAKIGARNPLDAANWGSLEGSTQ